MTPHLPERKKIVLTCITKDCFNTYLQEDQAQDDKKIQPRSHRQPEFWHHPVPDFASLKLPITDTNSLLGWTHGSRGGCCLRGHRSQTWGPPAPPLASLGGSHCIHPPRLLCLWGISPPNQRFGKNTTVIVNVFLGGGMPGISNDGKIISPVDKQAVSGVPGKQTWQCPGPGKSRCAPSIEEQLPREAQETLPLGCGGAAPHQGWQKETPNLAKVNILLQMSVLGGEKNNN